MLRSENFWKLESQALILGRNCGFLRSDMPASQLDSLFDRAEQWLADAEVDLDGPCPVPHLEASISDSKSVTEILVKDALRTFSSQEFQSEYLSALVSLHNVFGDYHQGLGFITAVLLLVMSKDRVYRLLYKMNESEKYLRGYWKAAPQAFVRDARVLQRLHHSLAQQCPEVDEAAKRAEQCGMIPEAYAQKYFCGLCVHVLPFEALFSFLSAFFAGGSLFLLAFGFSMMKDLSVRILSAKKTDVVIISALLRLDAEQFPGMSEGKNSEFFMEIVRGAREEDLALIDEDAVQKMRAEEQAKIDVFLEKIRKAEEDEEVEEDESDDEDWSDSDE